MVADLLLAASLARFMTYSAQLKLQAASKAPALHAAEVLIKGGVGENEADRVSGCLVVNLWLGWDAHRFEVFRRQHPGIKLRGCSDAGRRWPWVQISWGWELLVLIGAPLQW